MWLEKEGLQNIFGIIQKTGDIIKNINKKESDNNNDFLNSPCTKAFIWYLNNTYTPEQLQQQLWSSDVDWYMTKIRKESWWGKIDKIVNIVDEFTSKEIKPELKNLKEKIKNNEIVKNIPLINNVSMILSSQDQSQNNSKRLIDEFVWLSQERDREIFIQSHWIALTQKTDKINKEIQTPKNNNNNNNNDDESKKKEDSKNYNNIDNTSVDIEKIKKGIFASESQNEKDPYKANNPKSSAIGKYQFLWNDRKDKINEITHINNEYEYINNPKQQEIFMDHVIENEYLPKAKEYQSLYTNRKIPEIIMLIHFKWKKWALDWIKSKKDNTTANNISIDKYIDNFQKKYYV